MIFKSEKDPAGVIRPTLGGRERAAYEGFSGWGATLGAEAPRALLSGAAINAGTLRLVSTSLELGWLAGAELPEPPFRAPPHFDSLCGVGQRAMEAAPNLCQLAQIDVAAFAERREARAALVSLAQAAARARGDGYAALRLNEGLGTELVTATLDWLHGVCFPVGTADYGRIGAVLDTFAPFLRGVNAEVAAPVERKQARARRVAELDEQRRAADAEIQAAEVERKLHQRQPVTLDELAAAAKTRAGEKPTPPEGKKKARRPR